MTVINVALTQQTGAGRVPAAGRLSWKPTKRQVDGSVVILPAGSGMDLPAGTGVVDLAPGVYWFVEDVNGGESAYRIVPEAGPVDYSAMAAVDPATLDPEAVPDAAWYAYTDSLTAVAQSAADAATESQTSALASADSASGSATAAATSAQSASDSAAAALGSMGVAVDASGAASLSASSAAQSELAAAGYRADAGNSATAAGQSADRAESARGSMVTGGLVDENGQLVLTRVADAPQLAGHVVGPPITLTIGDVMTGPDTPGTPGPQGLTGPKGDPGGLVDATPIASTTNLNDLTTPGLYRTSASADATLANNYPVAGRHLILMVMAGSTTAYRIQEAHIASSTDTGNVMYRRVQLNGAWQPWRAYSAQRVDNTAGRAIYTWDDLNTREQLVYGDTGVRILAPEAGWSVVSGQSLALRRSGSMVTLSGYLSRAAGTPGLIATVPVGFRPDRIRVGTVPYSLAPPVASVGIEASTSGTVTAVGTEVSGLTHYMALTWSTVDAWPATLPGSASGSIPNL